MVDDQDKRPADLRRPTNELTCSAATATTDIGVPANRVREGRQGSPRELQAAHVLSCSHEPSGLMQLRRDGAVCRLQMVRVFRAGLLLSLFGSPR